MSWIIVSAVKEEALPTLQVLERKNQPFEFYSLGVGPIHAAKAGVYLASVCRGKKLLYLGSAGCYYPFNGPHLVGVKRVVWSPTGERFGLAQRPEWLYPPIDIVRPSDGGSLPLKTVLTSTGITVTDHQPFANSEAELHEWIENMELYACIGELLEAAAETRIILGITNQIGSAGRKQWLQHRHTVAELTAAFVASSLD